MNIIRFINSKHFIITLFLLIGISIALPKIQYQKFLSQGDHGRDLYAFERTLSGEQPYQDYWWVYGPLMPYYYAPFNAILGHSMQSILIAEQILLLIAGLLILLTLKEYISSAFSFLGGLWFLAFPPVFFFTYSHTGGITVTCGILFCLTKYFKTKMTKYVYCTLFLSFILALIKINFGFMAIGLCFCFTLLHDYLLKSHNLIKSKQFYITSIIIIPVAILITYCYFLRGLTLAEIQECLPYKNSYRPYVTSPLQAIQKFIIHTKMITESSIENFIFFIILTTCSIQTILHLLNKNTLKLDKTKIIVAAILLIPGFILFSHEFLASSVTYRLNWTKPFEFILFFIILCKGTQNIHKIFRYSLWLIIIFMIFINSYKSTDQLKAHNIYTTPPFPHKKVQIFIGNPISWQQTVFQTATFLKNNVKEDESFFAMPYDVLYYYLTDKKSPTRQLIFFDHTHIPETQELSIIEELKKNKTNWIVLSSRINSKEAGLGFFGRTYCPILAKYIHSNYEPAKQIGDWENHPGWAWNHGTLIMKRKEN